MKQGTNKYGGTMSWSTHTIHRIATEGGGIPNIGCELAVIADNGDTVIWDEFGEVSTAITAELMVAI